MKNDIESAVVVPFLQSALTGILACVGVLAGCVVFAWPWAYAGLIACVVTFAAWVVFRGEVRRRLDFEAGVVPVAPAQPEPIQSFALEVDYDSGRSGDYLGLNVSPEKFTQWAQGVAGGRSLAESSWIGSHGLFSRGEYTLMLAELLKRGYIRRRSANGHQLGYEPSAKGAALFRGMSSPPTHSHTLTRKPGIMRAIR